MSEWHPIETAPTDGTDILAASGDWIAICRWDSRNPKPYWRAFGPWGVTAQRQRQPTHWIPLPELPK